MTREQFLEKSRDILFNAEMVKSILNGEKTVTRRIIKPQPPKDGSLFYDGIMDLKLAPKEGNAIFRRKQLDGFCVWKPPYQVGEILYARESAKILSMQNGKVKMLFKADNSVKEFEVSDKEYNRLYRYKDFDRWLSPYWQTKETARIFLKVNDVKVERLNDMCQEDCIKEGCGELSEEQFAHFWNLTIKKQDLNKYSWQANPWVWVIDFERIEQERENQ